MPLDREAMLRRRREYPGHRYQQRELPRGSYAVAAWRLTLEHSSEPGVALVSEVELTDSAAGESLRLFRNPDPDEIAELYSYSRRLGLLRMQPSERSRLVSDVDRATAFAGVLSRTADRENPIDEPQPGDFPAVAVENGFPTELYHYENESYALARRWLDLTLRRTEFELRDRRRGFEQPTLAASMGALRRRRRVEDWDGPEPGEVAETLFPQFRRWVEQFDLSVTGESLRREVEPLRQELFEAAVGVEDNIGWELSHLLESSRPERGAIAPTRTATLEVAQVMNDLLYRSVHYLGPLREDPKPSYRAGHSGLVATLGVKGEYMVAALNANRNLPTLCPHERGPEVMRLEEAVNYWAKRFSLVESVETHDTGRPGIELLLVDEQTGENRDLTSVGVGASQLLPVIVLCLLAQPGELVLLEQPELHLHPAPQQILGDFLLEIAETGRQLLVETHSEYLINRLRLRVVEDQTNSIQEKVQIWYGRRTGGRTRFDSLEPNVFGSFDDWPEGFFDQAPREAEQILRAAARKRRSLSGGASLHERTSAARPAPDASPSEIRMSSDRDPEGSGVPAEIREHVIRLAPPDLAQHELAFVSLSAEELGLKARRPASGKPAYINLFPAANGGKRRAATFEPSSGRLEIYCDPAHAVDWQNAEVVERNGMPYAVKVYLKSKAAVVEALELTRLGLAER